jgi:hypothetical protein
MHRAVNLFFFCFCFFSWEVSPGARVSLAREVISVPGSLLGDPGTATRWIPDFRAVVPHPSPAQHA